MEDVTMEGKPPEDATAVAADQPQAQSSGKVSARQKYGWALGGLTDNGLTYGIFAMTSPIYMIGLGISAVWLGWAMAIPRIFDAIVDPLIGNLSDNTRSRWGRRRPYIFAGAIVSTIAFALVWLPPLGLSKSGLFTYYLIFSMIMFMGYAPYSIALSALGLEISPDSAERTRAQGLRVMFVNITGLALPWLFKLCTLPVFGGTAVMGIRYVGPALAVILLIAGVLPAILCREQTQAFTQPKVDFWPAFKALMSHKVFLLLIAVSLCVTVGTFLVSSMLFVMLLYYVCGGNESFTGVLNGWGGTAFAVMSIVMAPMIASLGIRFGKKQTICLGIILTMAGYAATWFFLTPQHPWWSILPFPLMCAGSACVFIFIPAMTADLCVIDELETGFRREGMFGALSALLGKTTFAICGVLAGYLLSYTGYMPGETPSAHTIYMMRVLYVACPAVLLSLGLFLALRYPITEKRVAEARAMLDARKYAPAEPAAASAD